MTENDHILKALLDRIPSNRDALLRALISRLDDSMISEIALCDYGYDVELNEQAISAICKAGEAPLEVLWNPREVLELTRWTRPADPETAPEDVGSRGHIKRAFACCVLVHDPAHGAGGENQSVAALVESVILLGEDLPRRTLHFLSWCVRETDIEEEERIFYILAMLILVNLDTESRNDDKLIKQLAYWIELEEDRIRREGHPCDERWLLGITFFDIYHDIWIRLARDVLTCGASQAIGRRIIEASQQERRSKRQA